ncbi:Rho-GTPase-activating protein LRG1 [Pyrenophora tritici-repentis]|uniref:Rho-GTPase-activating protein LRG1 n=1 Tax=Pyrenophora tritici-repentis TaxID=45151 RepID=A0A2W1HUS5_9PLEO|nr:Rho-GTPase-activating protein LRG1 [Pyrenophora tritici-repentis]KAF7445938.1 Rho-GTPase-activating protein [Pyrenophora tritici-repentis]KAF7567033.1 Rho-GTPase-activating protein LRG1 [Pyrenophora tritici-repentis]KAG9381647.1 Rho-GTPase-activating protein LRG1 [Pyrenophora tritici-repentis]KAI0571817.1 Rho-GTPase-activating protein LRG1 [Pyrenophora tritici-repentis]
MGTPAEGPPPMDSQGVQQQYNYDPRSNGLPRRATDEATLASNNLAPHNHTNHPTRSSTDPGEHHHHAPKPKRSGKICGKCGEGLTGQFVRALGDTYHLECFTCHDCSKIVASKFFPVPEKPPGQYPLCETDYFRRLDLLCFECGQALRGSYITALDRKYHIEHFTCSVCPTVFGASDSYYEHEGSVYCHYHYSTKFAQRCNGCQTSILKQFVEIFRNGQNQHWHPECYMIHKYWNVRLHSTGQPIIERLQQEADTDATDDVRESVRQQEEEIEAKVNWIWKTLSAFEEKSATCISDMLLHVSNGAYVDGVMAAKKFIVHVELLFAAADALDAQLVIRTPKGLTYSRESKLLCKKVVAFFALLTQSQGTGVRRLGVTQELLSLVTGLAHYLKLLIRICLQGALKLERETRSSTGLTNFLTQVNSLDARLEDEAQRDQAAESARLVPRWADACPICDAQVEDKCLHLNHMSFNYSCMVCRGCNADLRHDTRNAYWSKTKRGIYCPACAAAQSDAENGFEQITKLRQYVHLLNVAHARLMATLRSSGALPHTSDDPNLAGYDSSQGHRLGDEPPHLRGDTRSKSYGGTSTTDSQQSANAAYEQSMSDIKRLRSTRLDKHLSNTMKRARASRIIDGPEGLDSAGGEGQLRGGMQIVQEGDGSNQADAVTLAVNSLALDDIARMAALEQQREQRPNAFRAGGSALLGRDDQPRLQNGHRRDFSGAQDLQIMSEGRSRTFFSELSPLEYFKLKGLAVLQLGLLLDDSQYNQGELLDLIESKKNNFWGKIGFGKAFKADKTKPKKGVPSGVEKPVSDKATFRQSLEYLVEKYGDECTEGVGPGALKVPALLQECITAMRNMDMSIEGVFRKNGNLKALRELEEEIDANGVQKVDLNTKNPVILANLLKRFLRLMPEPVLTLKLYRLFMVANDIEDEAQRKKVLHLVLCLLPKAHRDTMEVLFCFLNWVSSFHTVDEETGNKMDTWNIATVMAPNILRESNDKEVKSVDQGAVKVVFDLIENNDEFSEVPPEIMELLSDEVSDMSAKEIMRQWEQRGKNPLSAPPAGPREQAGTASRKDQRNAPQITTADNNPSAQAGETHARQAGGLPSGPANNQQSPGQGYDRGTPNAAYGPNPQASAESHRTASPHRHSYRSPGFQKHTQIGTAGAG